MGVGRGVQGRAVAR